MQISMELINRGNLKDKSGLKFNFCNSIDNIEEVGYY